MSVCTGAFKLAKAGLLSGQAATTHHQYLNISKPFSQFLADAATGRLPDIAFIDPRFEDEGSGTSGDDHPHADIRDGQVFLNRIYDAIRTSPQWSSTVLVINYDEWAVSLITSRRQWRRFRRRQQPLAIIRPIRPDIRGYSAFARFSRRMHRPHHVSAT